MKLCLVNEVGEHLELVFKVDKHFPEDWSRMKQKGVGGQLPMHIPTSNVFRGKKEGKHCHICH